MATLVERSETRLGVAMLVSEQLTGHRPHGIRTSLAPGTAAEGTEP